MMIGNTFIIVGFFKLGSILKGWVEKDLRCALCGPAVLMVSSPNRAVVFCVLLAYADRGGLNISTNLAQNRKKAFEPLGFTFICLFLPCARGLGMMWYHV